MAANRRSSLSTTDRPQWGLAFLGLFLLAVPAMILVGLAVGGAVLEAESIALGSVLLSLALLALRGIAFEFRTVRAAPEIEPIDPTEMIGIAGAIMIGGFVTFVLVVEGGLTPVVAASVTGLLAVVVRRPLAVPAYCGAFVGMTSPIVFPTYWQGLVAAALAVAVYLLAQPVFHGVGGKLGTTAFVGAALTILGTPTSFLGDQLPASDTVALAVGFSVVAAVVTFTLHHRSPLDPVSASGVVGLLGGVALPWLYPAVGGLLAAAVYAASFAGMSDSTRIPDERWMALAGIVVGLVVAFTEPYLGGSGGKLGTIAFVSCLAVYGLLGTLHQMIVKMHVERLPRRDVS
ncbi:hypothetical protein QA600_09565 [Natronococcus sp. A-GB1]|uniref:hypothetical protein n=1 Tax=Natronococcus sp. A-GB1 TaxID=3037648 RepID=UPI00241D408E|nr:hypothetical protein [Natronococcus sp. A-GB1]MDG5759586.1 hypothetical protein [Natronococcus sp. A-GB1]